MDKKINFPIILVSVRNNLEVITNSDQITHITSLAFRDKTLIDAIIFDSNGSSYKINNVLKIENLNPWWKFDYFNPMIKINLLTADYSNTLLESKEIIINAIKAYPEFWDSEDLQDIVNTVENSSTMS